MKKLTAFLLTCSLCLACLLPAAVADSAVEEQDQFWNSSGLAALWNAMNVEGGVRLTEEEKNGFLAGCPREFEMNGADENCIGSFRIGEDATFRAELFAWEDRTVVSGRIAGIIRLSDWVYGLETDGLEWEEDAYPELVQNQMLLQIPGVAPGEGGYLVYSTENVAEELGADPESPAGFWLLTGFDSTPLWYYNEPADGE